MDDTAARGAAPAQQPTTHSLTIPEVVQRFADAGVPRAPRTIQTYCQVGTLDCIRVPGELGLKYLVNEKSVANRIEEFIQMRDLLSHSADAAPQARFSASERAQARNSAQERASQRSADDVEEGIGEIAKAQERIEQLEGQTRLLEIDKRVRDEIITRLDNDRQQMLATVAEQGRQIGKLEAQLALLEAPKGDNSREREMPTAL